MAGLTTAVIVNWNGARFLGPLLESLKSEALSETIVVDNASQDDSADVVRAHSNIRVIRNDVNVGFGAAANQGIEAGKTPYILILNADTEILPGAVNDLEKFLSNHPDAAIAAPQLLSPDRRLQTSCRTFPTILKYTLFLSYLDRIIPTGYRLSQKKHAQVREVDQPMGAALLIRKTALEQTGVFDPQFTLYMEEVDLCERLKQADWKIFYVPEAKVIHHAGGSTDQDWARSQTQHFENVLRYFRKRISKPKMVLLRASLSAALFLRSVVNLLTLRIKRSLFYAVMSCRVLIPAFSKPE